MTLAATDTAVEIASGVQYAAWTVEFSFIARVPGAFVYHCGTYPVLQHIANGMFGAITVDPALPLPPADVCLRSGTKGVVHTTS